MYWIQLSPMRDTVYQPVCRHTGLLLMQITTVLFYWSLNRLPAWIKLTLNQTESRNVQWSASSDRLFSSQLTKPCTAVSLPEQRCQNNLVPHFGALCSLTTFRLSNVVFIASFFGVNTHVHIAAAVAKFLLLPDEEQERKTCYYDKIIPIHSLHLAVLDYISSLSLI